MKDFQLTRRIILNNIAHTPKVPSSPAESGFFQMKEYDVTKLPFTSISRENWEMLLELPEEELYAVIQAVGNYVLTGKECDCGTLVSRVVCNQLISVIDRKGQKSFNSQSNLPDKKKRPVSQGEDKPAPQPVPRPAPEITMDDDAYFEEFFNDPTMDYSTLIGNVSYFKERKRDELNKLFQKLRKRYSGDKIIQVLQEKYMERMNR